MKTWLQIPLLMLVLFGVVRCGRERVKLPQAAPSPSPTTEAQKKEYQDWGAPGQIPNITNFTNGGIILPVYIYPTAGQCAFVPNGPTLTTSTSATAAANVAWAKSRNDMVKQLFPQWAQLADNALKRIAYRVGANVTSTASAGSYLAFGRVGADGKFTNPDGYDPYVHRGNIPSGVRPLVECATVYDPGA